MLAAWWTPSWSRRNSSTSESALSTTTPPRWLPSWQTELQTLPSTSGSHYSSSSRYELKAEHFGDNQIFVQAGLFYIPRRIWKSCEGGLMQTLGKCRIKMWKKYISIFCQAIQRLTESYSEEMGEMKALWRKIWSENNPHCSSTASIIILDTFLL